MTSCCFRRLLCVAVTLCAAIQAAALNEEEHTPQQPTRNAVDDHHDHHHHDDKNHSFCHGMYMTMFMDGFRFSLSRDSKSHHHHSNNNNSTSDTTPPCLAYYVRSWKLSMSGKFRGAMVFSFLFALLTEGLAASRFKLIDYIRHFDPRHRKAMLTVVYALQSWMGTMIMLVSMMYSIELLLSVVAGLMVGNFLFVRDHPQKNRGIAASGGITGSSPHPPTTTEPSRAASAAEESVEGLGSVSGLQMQTRKEE